MNIIYGTWTAKARFFCKAVIWRKISPTNTTESPIIAKPTTVEQSATTTPSLGTPLTENTIALSDYVIQEYPVPAGR